MINVYNDVVKVVEDVYVMVIYIESIVENKYDIFGLEFVYFVYG